MPDGLDQIVQRMIDAGEPEDNIAMVIREYKPQIEANPRTWTDTAVDALPTIGGMVGGAIGGAGGTVLGMGVGGVPGAIGGAAVGGVAGESARQVVNALRGKPLPESVGSQAKDMAVEGATQAGAEVGGRLISGGLRMGANRLYQSVLKPSAAAQREYPTMIQYALDRMIPVSKGGTEKAGALASESRGAADALVQAAANAPNAPMVDPATVVGGIVPAVSHARNLQVRRPTMQAIGGYARDFLRENPAPMPLTRAQAMVRETDRGLNTAYRAAIDAGDRVGAGRSQAAMGINDAMRSELRANVPGLQQQNATTQALAGLRGEIANRAGVPNVERFGETQLTTGGMNNNRSAVGMQHLINAGLGAAAGTASDDQTKGVGTFLALEALTNPAIASRMAIGGNAAARLPFSQFIRAALMARMAGQGDGTER